jgi:hypothetical protein
VGSGFSGTCYERVAVPVEAVAASGWRFDGWTDGEAAAARKVTLHGDETLTARFVAE